MPGTFGPIYQIKDEQIISSFDTELKVWVGKTDSPLRRVYLAIKPVDGEEMFFTFTPQDATAFGSQLCEVADQMKLEDAAENGD
jgi:hypothetical protein